MSTFGQLVADLQKVGARHGKKDKALVQAAHDNIAAMVDCAHCSAGVDKASRLIKTGQRHSKADLQKIEQCHDLVCQLGALCPGEGQPLGGQNPTGGNA